MMQPCPVCAHRCELPKLFEDFKVGVEVGVLHASYSTVLLREWPGFLHLIDPWTDYDEYDPERPQDWKQNFHVAMERLSAFAVPGTFSPPGADPRMPWSKMQSARFRVWKEFNGHDVANKIGKVDFAYIDGNHAFKYVWEDLHIWWEHLRPGGILAGHDLFQMVNPGVTQALVMFSLEVDRDVFTVPGKDGCPCGEGGVPSWYIRK